MVDQGKFNGCIKAVAQGRAECVEVMREALVDYPWFMTARLICASQTDVEDSLAELHWSAHPRPVGPLAGISLEEFGVCPRRSGAELIERFLRGGEHRIVPDNATPEDDQAEQSGRLDLSDDLVSEELAAIYLAQGLNRQAKEIYERLCLLNPEKSIYFAAIIERIGD